MKKSILLLALLVATDILSVLHAQPRYDRTQLNLEHLNRGVVAFRGYCQLANTLIRCYWTALRCFPQRTKA